MTAQSLGFHGIHFDNTDDVVVKLRNLLADPVARGMDFLRQRSQQLFCETDQGVIIRDNFSQLLILEFTGERNLVFLENGGNTWQYFIGERAFTDSNFPQDVDTTSLALVTLSIPSEQKEQAMQKILGNLSADGLPLAYFDSLRPRFCPYVAANVLRLFYLNGQGRKLQATLQYLCRILCTQAYEVGSRYYRHPDWIIYYLADLCCKCTDPDLEELREVVTKQLKRRMGTDKEVLAAALRLLAAQSLDLDSPEDLQTLLTTQQLDGGWELGWMLTYGNVAVKIGNRGVTTSMAVKAIRVAYERPCIT
ncbi:HAD-like protein [Hirsutella rhossiliensis]|uniref:HAD-like protein n=1 Tax=Hirsutella rhossiliensis TaxID=111463 RepID=A0A9P8N4W7_9HYPO|nr:HAD-like protein [Hirsutella rhossiliensis]KAH0965996.1 HAD-like protein [Hirsutella rhossiliensis]